MYLLGLLYDSGLSAREFASAIGVADRTIERHLAGGRRSRLRRSWYQKVQSVTVDQATRNIHIVVSYTAPTRKPFGWSRDSREKSKRARSKRGAL